MFKNEILSNFRVFLVSLVYGAHVDTAEAETVLQDNFDIHLLDVVTGVIETIVNRLLLSFANLALAAAPVGAEVVDGRDHTCPKCLHRE